MDAVAEALEMAERVASALWPLSVRKKWASSSESTSSQGIRIRRIFEEKVQIP